MSPNITRAKKRRKFNVSWLNFFHRKSSLSSTGQKSLSSLCSAPLPIGPLDNSQSAPLFPFFLFPFSHPISSSLFLFCFFSKSEMKVVVFFCFSIRFFFLYRLIDGGTPLFTLFSRIFQKNAIGVV